MAKSKARRRAKKKANKTASKAINDTAIDGASENANENADDNANDNANETANETVKEKGEDVVQVNADKNAKNPDVFEVPLTVNGISLTEYSSHWIHGVKAKHYRFHLQRAENSDNALALWKQFDASIWDDDMLILDVGCASGAMGQLVEHKLEDNGVEQAAARIMYMDANPGFAEQIVDYVSDKFSSMQKPVATDAKDHFINADYRLGFKAIVQRLPTAQLPRMLEGFDLVTMLDVVHLSTPETRTKSIEVALSYVRPGGSLLFNLSLQDPAAGPGANFMMGVRTITTKQPGAVQKFTTPRIVHKQVVWVSNDDLKYCKEQFEELVGRPFQAFDIAHEFCCELRGRHRYNRWNELAELMEEMEMDVSDVESRSQLRRELVEEEECKQDLAARELGSNVISNVLYFGWSVCITKKKA